MGFAIFSFVLRDMVPKDPKETVYVYNIINANQHEKCIDIYAHQNVYTHAQAHLGMCIHGGTQHQLTTDHHPA